MTEDLDLPWCNNCGGDLKLLETQPDPKPKGRKVAACNKCGIKDLIPIED